MSGVFPKCSRAPEPPTPPRTDTSPPPCLPFPVSLVNQVRASTRVGVNGRTPTTTRTTIKVRGSAQELRREEQQRGGRPAGRTAHRPNETGQHALPLLLPGNNTGTFKLRHTSPPSLAPSCATPAGHSHRLYARSPARTPPPPSLKICTHAFLILRRTLSTNRRAPRCIIHQPHFLFSVPQSWGEVWGGGSDLLLFGNCNLSLHLTDRREQKSSLFLKKGGEAAQALNTYTIKFWHSFQDKSPQKQQKM